MAAVRRSAVVEEDGQVTLRELPFRKGDRVQVTLLKAGRVSGRRASTAAQFLESPLIGMWADRTDIPDSSVFARGLRELMLSCGPIRTPVIGR